MSHLDAVKTYNEGIDAWEEGDLTTAKEKFLEAREMGYAQASDAIIQVNEELNAGAFVNVSIEFGQSLKQRKESTDYEKQLQTRP